MKNLVSTMLIVVSLALIFVSYKQKEAMEGWNRCEVDHIGFIKKINTILYPDLGVTPDNKYDGCIESLGKTQCWAGWYNHPNNAREREFSRRAHQESAKYEK